MKRIFSVLMAFLLLLGCVMTMSACDKKDDKDDGEQPDVLKVTAPDGYKVWKNDEIGLAYPEDWESSSMSGVLFFAQSEQGESINAGFEAKNSIYGTLTTENFTTVMGPTFEMINATVTNATVTKYATANGVPVVKATFKTTMNVQGMTVTVWQTQFYVDVAEKSYAVTVTAMTEDALKTIADVVTQTLVAAK